MKKLILKDGTSFEAREVKRIYAMDIADDAPKATDLITAEIKKTEEINFDTLPKLLTPDAISEIKVTEDNYTSPVYKGYSLSTVSETVEKDSDFIRVEFIHSLEE